LITLIFFLKAHVGQSIFNGCIKEALQGKTRILVTHHIHLLSECDLIIVLEDGAIKASGSFQELTHSGIDLSAILPAPKNSPPPEIDDGSVKISGTEVDEDVELEDDNDVIIDAYRELSVDKTPVISSSVKILRSGSVSESVNGSFSRKVTVPASPGKKVPSSSEKLKGPASPAKANGATLMTTEERSTGDVSTDIYWYYIRAGGLWMSTMYLLLLTLVQAFSLGSSFYLTYWGSQSINQDEHGHPMSSEKNLSYMEVFAALSMAGVLCTVARGLCLAQMQLKASLALHKSVLDRVLGAPVAFFDVTPLGWSYLHHSKADD